MEIIRRSFYSSASAQSVAAAERQDLVASFRDVQLSARRSRGTMLQFSTSLAKICTVDLFVILS